MKTIFAPSLKPGDTVGVIAPAGVVDGASLASGIGELERLGLVVQTGEHLFDHYAFHAGKHDDRLVDLNRMISDERVRGIICARGGYGSVYLLAGLDLASLRRNPKVIMGASDITVLLNFIHQRTGLVTYHGPMVAGNFSKGMAAIEPLSLRQVMGVKTKGKRPKSWSLGLKSNVVVRQGRARGRLMGGCLSLLVSTLGTHYEINTRGSILYLEDVNEAPYRIDRMLKQLQDSGKFQHVQGLIFGEMLNCEDPKSRQWKTRQVIESFFEGFKGPIAMGVSSGHTRNMFITLPIGAPAILDLQKQPHLTFALS
jgi:muramoyltetrapeptide carboxypeptidase